MPKKSLEVRPNIKTPEVGADGDIATPTAYPIATKAVIAHQVYFNPERKPGPAGERGPWDGGADKIGWVDEETGVRYISPRQKKGLLSGFAAVDPDHPLFGFSSGALQQRPELATGRSASTPQRKWTSVKLQLRGWPTIFKPPRWPGIRQSPWLACLSAQKFLFAARSVRYPFNVNSIFATGSIPGSASGSINGTPGAKSPSDKVPSHCRKISCGLRFAIVPQGPDPSCIGMAPHFLEHGREPLFRRSAQLHARPQFLNFARPSFSKAKFNLSGDQ